MSSSLKRLSYIFFPRRCLLCGDVVLPDDELCGDCAEYTKTALLTGERTKTSLAEKPGSDAIGCAAQTPVFAPFAYDGPVRDSLCRLKFNGDLDSAPLLAKHMARSLQGAAEGFDAVCFIPLHTARQRARGYNQSEVLARHLARELGLALCDPNVLVRLRDTPSQREFDHAGRQVNVRGAFGLAEGAEPEGLRLLLVDDISTTGATLRECTNALLSAGAAELICVVAART
jgi:ComF family protein